MDSREQRLEFGYCPPTPAGRRPRRNRKRRDLNPIIRRWCAVVACIELAVFLLANPSFWVRHVRVEGLQSLTARQVFAATKMPHRTNIFLMALRVPLAKRIHALPEVDRVAIALDLPNTIVLRIDERTPYAVLQTGGQYWLTDNKQIPYRTVRGPVAGLPTIQPTGDAAATPVVAGHRIGDDWLVQTYHLLSLVQHNANLNPKSITVDQNANMCLNRLDNLRVNVGSPDDLDTKLAIADQTVRSGGADIASKVAYIDVSCPSQPALMPRHEPTDGGHA